MEGWAPFSERFIPGSATELKPVRPGLEFSRRDRTQARKTGSGESGGGTKRTDEDDFLASAKVI